MPLERSIARDRFFDVKSSQVYFIMRKKYAARKQQKTTSLSTSTALIFELLPVIYKKESNTYVFVRFFSLFDVK